MVAHQAEAATAHQLLAGGKVKALQDQITEKNRVG
jgi:hypothetical protein